MILVVADTSPLNYLIQLGQAEALPRLFDEVHVPVPVLEELRQGSAPAEVRRWAQAPPAWARVDNSVESSIGENLGLGETAAISVALTLGAQAVLLDDRRARGVALARGLKVIGSIRLLEMAAERGWIELRSAFERLRSLGFRADEALFENSLSRFFGRSRRPQPGESA